jgi:leucyl aminopeptidase
MSGWTVEVINTDAEGRLVLCATTWTQRNIKPTAIVDLATLTGAMVITLGHEYAGIFLPTTRSWPRR